MILSFMTHFENGKPTYFLDKIQECESVEKKSVLVVLYQTIRLHKNLPYDVFTTIVDLDRTVNPKIHTLRRDKQNKWKKGKKIEFVIFEGTHIETCFSEGKCTGIQRVVLVPEAKEITLIDSSAKFGMRQIEDIEQFAKNEGFDSVEEFWEYYDKPEAYTIIHWTDFKY